MKKVIIVLTVLMTSIVVTEAQLPEKIKENTEYTLPSGLKIKFLTLNKKAKQAVSGNKVKINFIGKLTNDTVFTDTYKSGSPLTLTFGETKVKGLDEGIGYMHVGDKAVLTVPPALGFGDKEVMNVPPNSTIIFTVELIDVIEPPKPYDAKGKDTISLKSGLKYIIVSNGNGIKVDSGMNVKVHYTGFFTDGKIFDSSVERSEPIDIPIGKGKVIKGWDEGITRLHVGDKAKLFVPYQLAYGEAGRGPIPAKANLIFDVEVVSASAAVKAEPYEVKGKDTLTTASGLKYIVVKDATGLAAAKGKNVKVHYTGYFTDNSIFDSSVERGEPFSFVLGKGQVIPGWDEGVALMKVGEKARFIIPYQLGYGEKGYGPIPAKATLIFDVELLEVK